MTTSDSSVWEAEVEFSELSRRKLSTISFEIPGDPDLKVKYKLDQINPPGQ